MRSKGILVATLFAAVSAACGIGRSHVKSLRDRDADRVRLGEVKQTTISALNAVRPRCGPTRDRRVRDEEFQVFQVVGRIARVKRERDRDIHIVLEDPDHPGDRLIAESADPRFRGNAASPYRDSLTAARQMLDDLMRQSATAGSGDLHGVLVRVTGVGFFDMNHFQSGRSRSCIELHPILAIERAE